MKARTLSRHTAAWRLVYQNIRAFKIKPLTAWPGGAGSPAARRVSDDADLGRTAREFPDLDGRVESARPAVRDE
jgi:hypothetical protein